MDLIENSMFTRKTLNEQALTSEQILQIKSCAEKGIYKQYKKTFIQFVCLAVFQFCTLHTLINGGLT